VTPSIRFRLRVTRGADIALVWRPLVAMLIIGAVYFAVAQGRFRRVIFGG